MREIIGFTFYNRLIQVFIYKLEMGFPLFTFTTRMWVSFLIPSRSSKGFPSNRILAVTASCGSYLAADAKRAAG